MHPLFEGCVIFMHACMSWCVRVSQRASSRSQFFSSSVEAPGLELSSTGGVPLILNQSAGLMAHDCWPQQAVLNPGGQDRRGGGEGMKFE